jgi:hypothetical protein
MSDPPASPPGQRSSRVAATLLVLGGLIIAFGLLGEAPLSAAADWKGIVDSASTFASADPGLMGRAVDTKGIALHLHGAGSPRATRLPPAFAFLGDSVRTGDTVHLSVGWRPGTDTALALLLIRNGVMLMDSAVVLRGQRQQRTRTAEFGGLLLLAGLAGLLRRGGRPVDPAGAGLPGPEESTTEPPAS